MNSTENSTAASGGARLSFEEAFSRLEGPLDRLLTTAKTQTVLMDAVFHSVGPKTVSGDQNEAICHVANLIREIAEQLDQLWLEGHNADGKTVWEAAS